MSETFHRTGSEEGGRPAVSVIIPARNEERNIERVVRSIAAQNRVREILVIDDGSIDHTREILNGLEAQIELLRTLSAGPLPDGWTGKNHALWVGAQVAQGEWLLFTDADTEHLPESLETVVDRAEAAGVDLLSLSPGQETITWWEKAIIPFVFVELARLYDFKKISDPKAREAAANGQYLLIRRSIYTEVGGHEAVRGEILEDLELARRVKGSGARLFFLPGPQWVRTRMYRSFREMWEGWSKNLYLLYGRNLEALIAAATAVLTMDIVVPAALVALCILLLIGNRSLPVEIAALACFIVVIVRRWTYGRRLLELGFDISLASFHLTGAGLYGVLLLNSAREYRLRNRVRWKGRSYPVGKTT